MAKPLTEANFDTIINECIAVRVRLLNRVVTKIFDDSLRPLGSLSAFAVGPEGIPYAPGTRAIVDSGRTPEAGDYVVLRNFDDAGKEIGRAHV